MHADVTAVTIQSKAIASNEVKDMEKNKRTFGPTQCIMTKANSNM